MYRLIVTTVMVALFVSVQAQTPHYAYSYRVKGKSYNVLTKRSAKQYKRRGKASWYGPGFHGKRAANGSRYNMYAMTAASKELPLGSLVKVTNLKNHKAVVVKITDRGPFVNKRLIDLSYSAAKKLGVVSRGVASVEVSALV